MRSVKQFFFATLGAALAVSGLTALQATPATASVSAKISSFPYSQDWSGLTAASTWADFPGVEGFTTGVSISPSNQPNTTEVGLLTAEGTLTSALTPLAGNTPNTNSNGGVLAYHSATDKTVALSATGTITTPLLAFHLDTSGESGIGVAYDVQDLDSSADDQPTRVALQYRVGTSGSYVNVPGGYVTDATGPGNTAVTSTHVAAALPAAADNQADVFVRVITLDNATGSNEHIGIDNIDITTGGVVEPDPLAATNPGNKTFTQNQAIAPVALQATGGTSPYSWEVTGGDLPDGLDLVGNQISGTPTTVTPSPVEITLTATDSATPTPATATATFTITVQAPLPITPIAQLQGTGDRSPYAPPTGTDPGEETVSTTGIVTGIYRDPSFANNGFDGFYLQTGGTGGSVPTGGSHAIFVYGASAIPGDLEVGDSVQATGKISEFFGLTELNAPTGGVVELGAALPDVTALATAYPTTEAGREAIEGMLLDPTDDFTVTNAYSTNQYGEVGLATGDEPLRQPTEHAAPSDTAAVQAIRDENAERSVVLDDGTSVNYLGNQATKAQPVPWLTGADGNANPAPPRVGAGVTLHQPVILDYRNNAWKLQPRLPVFKNGADVATFEDTRAADATPADVLTMTPGRTGDLKIATFNVLNYFNTTGEAYTDAGPLQNPPLDTFCTYYTDRGPGTSQRIGNDSCGVRLLDDPTTEKDESKDNDGRGPRGAATAASLARQEAKLVHTINALGADVIGLEEVENSIKLPGETNRDDAVARLVQILNDASGAGTWAYVRSPGEALTAAAVAEQDVIRPAFIYKVAKVEPVGGSDILFGTTEFANAREPLAQVFKAKGAPDSDGFAVVVNHFKSKGDNPAPIPPATGDNAQNGEVGAFNGDRVRQATRLVQFANDFAAERDVDAVFLAGDFNSYTKEDPIGVLTGADYTLIESKDEGDESYSYQGLSGSLDHVLGNPAAMDMVTGADIWEINANEAASFQYSRYNYNVTDFWLPNKPWATSDHNPEIVGIEVPDFTPTSYKEIQVIGTNDFHGRLLPDAGNAAGAAPFASAVKDLEAQFPPGSTAFVAAGDLVGASTFESFIQDDEPTIDALNAMGLDVSAAGNHEFDRGYADLEGRIRDRADWEYIAANLDYAPGVAEEDKLAETWATTLDGVKVGFVGAVTEDLPGLVNPAGIEDITVTDVVDATNEAAEELKTAGAEIVVLLVHEGAPTTECDSASFTDPATVWGNIVQNTSSDVDAIISGHTHLAYNCRYTVPDWQADSSRTVKKRPVVSAGQYGTNLNQLVFKFDETSGDLEAISQDVIAAAGVGYAADPTVQAIVDDAVTFAAAEGATILGKMTGPFKRATYKSAANADLENRGGESTLSNQIAEVQRWATDAAGIETDIAFMNPGGLRADMDGTANGTEVDLSYREAADVQPFANTLVNMKLTGAQLEEILEQQWQRTATGSVPSRPFLRLGVSKGFTYTYDETPETVTAPNSAPVQTFQGEVTGMWLDGVPVDAARAYSVTVNSFLGGGGDNFWEFADGAQKVDTGKVDLEAMVEYMKQYDTDALPVDYSQRGVEITLPDDAPASYGPGDTVAFEVGSWTMSAPGDEQDSEVEVRLGGTLLDAFAVDNAVGKQPYDRYGTATVSVTLPEDVFNGTTELTVSGATTGTSVPVIIQIEGGQEPTETPVVNQAPPTVSGVARIGQTLTASAGTWEPEPDSVVYQWYADGVPIPGATGRTLVLGGGQVGTRITVGVTARAAGHADATAVSAQVGPVAKGSATVSVKTKPKKIKLRKTRTKVFVTVTTPDGVAVTGSVTVKAKGQKARTVMVVNGKAKVRLKAFSSTGAKRIKVSYAGSALLSPAESVTKVRVVR
ncbi:ExeM/NucH family extracellular endonuclease [Nocardioides sp. LHD-245]|uniref:ExeM/NucH family extracellular endonuclease n=1 Tax=Nocardioides sp. LHD-245 TaxID=3051387 RepID=UPI0027E19A37|nr:ExeM/NucH family extracellular endonuclease [Nocardioides sp. LHD-245]